MSIGKRLRQTILLTYRNIKEFSDVSGISYNTLKKYIEENRSPHPDILIEIRTHLGIHIDWLLTGEGEMYIHSPTKEKFKWLGEEWLRNYWEKSDEQERIWLEVQMKKCFPEFKEWLEQQKS